MTIFKKKYHSKKGDIDEVVKIALWIVLAVALSIGVYFLMKSLAGTI